MNKISFTVSLFCLLLTTSCVFSQDLLPGFKFSEEGTVYISATDSIKLTSLDFEIYDDKKVVGWNDARRLEYKANSIMGFSLQKSGKRYISVKGALGGLPFFVEDLTPSNKRLKVVKHFYPDEPLVQKDGAVMGTWLHYVLPVKEDEDRKLISGYKKIAEFVKTDCIELNKKISSKQKGYFLTLMGGTVEEELEIYKRIATEFEQCK
jgi:hypothetical protein